MACANCMRIEGVAHDGFSHGRYEWIRVDGERKLERVSERCTAVVNVAGDEGRPCGCEGYEKEETQEERS